MTKRTGGEATTDEIFQQVCEREQMNEERLNDDGMWKELQLGVWTGGYGSGES